MPVGENIKMYRTNLGLTQKQLAEKCSLSESAIKYYESNRRNPKIETLNKIAKALNIELNDLLGIETSTKKINKQFYENASIAELSKLIKPVLDLDLDKYALLPANSKELIMDKLAEIDPAKLKLKSYLNNFDNFTKQDLIDYSDFLRKYSNEFFLNFIKTDFTNILKQHSDLVKKHNELISEYNNLVEVLSIKDEYIENLKESVSHYQELSNEAQQLLRKIAFTPNENNEDK